MYPVQASISTGMYKEKIELTLNLSSRDGVGNIKALD
jgi:hypothetical protein